MTGSVECRYHGRDFSTDEMALLRALIASPPALNRHALSKEFCRRIDWYKADGGLKDMMARVVMLAMHKDGRIELPPPKWPRPPRRPTTFGPDTEPPLLPPPDTLPAVRPLSLRPIVGYSRKGKLWNEYVARYHYLGYTTLVGAQMRYAVHAHDGTPLAMLGFSTAAWTLAPRDNFIGSGPCARTGSASSIGRICNRHDSTERLQPLLGLDQDRQQERGFVLFTSSMAYANELGGTSLSAARGGRRSVAANDSDTEALDGKLSLAQVDLDRFVVVVLRQQEYAGPARGALETFDRDLVVDACDDDLSVARLGRLVHGEEIPVEDAGTGHAVPAHP